MFRRFAALRDRFITANLSFESAPGAVTDAQGVEIGQILRVVRHRNRLKVSVRSAADRIRLDLGDMSTELCPEDGAVAHQLVLPWPPALSARDGRPRLTIADHPPIPLPTGERWSDRARLTLELLWILARMSPAILQWRLHGDLVQRSRVKQALRLDLQTANGPIPADLFETAPQPELAATKMLTIVLPVHNAFEVLSECLSRVTRHTSLPWQMIAVEDASTDPRVRPALHAWASAQGPGQVTVIAQDINRGFIASVNTALHHLFDPDQTFDPAAVVLLNSDALVPAGWAERLIDPILANPQVASVTPMSNDAEIFSVPAICQRVTLGPGQAAAIDAVARRLAPGPSLASAPTGVGFCMALSPRFLKEVPQLDEAFGRGYGEEVDWCQKVRAMGGRHLGTARLFVAHRGGESFKNTEKQGLIARNNQIVSQRYPGYDGEVQAFINTDPLRGARLALAAAWAASLDPDVQVPIYLAHSLGGGADHWLETRIAADAAAGRPSVVLRVGGPERWQVEIVGPTGRVAGWTGQFALVRALLEPLGRRRIVYSCGVGDSDPVGLPNLLLQLRRGKRDRIEVLFHDYFPISPSFTLLDSDGVFRGAPTPARLAARPNGAAAHEIRRPDESRIDLADWQAAWGTLLEAADLIRVFCPSGAALVSDVWPQLADRLTVEPHRLDLSCPPLAPRPAQAPTLGVLGNIAPHKGAALVRDLAFLTTAQRQARMVLIGSIDPDFTLPGSLRVHGSYVPADIPMLAEHYGITHWLIPSVWPETFSFTTHEALATGLPVLAFDIGAQGDAVRAAPGGIPLPYDPQGDLVRTITATLSRKDPS